MTEGESIVATATQEAPATTASSNGKTGRKGKGDALVLAQFSKDGREMTDDGKAKVWLSKSTKHTLTLNLPDELRADIMADAKGRAAPNGTMGVADNVVAREILADHYGWYIPDNMASRAGEYSGMTKEEIKEKHAAERNTTRARVDAVLSAITAGLIPEDVLAKMGLDAKGNPLPKVAA